MLTKYVVFAQRIFPFTLIYLLEQYTQLGRGLGDNDICGFQSSHLVLSTTLSARDDSTSVTFLKNATKILG
jgi:nicotinamidase-related amidase